MAEKFKEILDIWFKADDKIFVNYDPEDKNKKKEEETPKP